MDAEWLTYREAAERLGSNIDAVRQRAIRCRWPRILGNDKRARIQIPEGVREGNEGALREGNDRAPRKGNEGAYDRPLIKALEAHVATLKEQLASEQAKTEKAIEAFRLLADRLDAMAETNQRRPWWKRLAG